MALLFADSFGHYSTSQLARKWNNFVDGSGGANTIETTAARINSGFYRSAVIGVASSQCYVTKHLGADIASWVIGFGFRATALTGIWRTVASLYDGVTAQADLRLDGDGTFYITRVGTIPTGGHSSRAIHVNHWYYLEWKITIADSIGAASCKLNVNGQNWITVTTGQDLKATANAFAQTLVLGKINTDSTVIPCSHDFCDLYILDSSGGSPNNDILGDRRVDVLLPSGAGNTSAWTASAGSNYQCVDETPPTDDTDYVSTATVNNVDTYAMGNITTTPSVVNGLQTNLTARKTDAGTRTIARVIRSAGTDYVGTTQAMSDDYIDNWEVSETDPATAAAWTESGVNAAEVGVKLIA